MKLARLILVTALFALLSALSIAGDVQWRTLAEGRNSSYSKLTLVQVQTKADWQSIWRNLGERSSCPTIDFTKQAVIFLALGEQANEGTSVYIETIDNTAGKMLVKAVRKVAQGGKKSKSNPWVAVSFDRIAGGAPRLELRDLDVYSYKRLASCSCSTCRTARCGCGCHNQNQVYYPLHLPWDVEEDGANCDIKVEGTWVITNKSDLRRYWNALYASMKEDDIPNMPRIDFLQDCLVAIHLGERFGTKHSIGIKTVQAANPNETIVTWWENSPSFVSRKDVKTQPFVLLRIPKETPLVRVMKTIGGSGF